MKVYYNGLRMEEISKYATREEVKNLLSKMTDEDFNGNNGEDYFVEVNIDGKLQNMSNLDYWMTKFESYENLKDFIYDVLESNYSDLYYTNHDIEIKEIHDTLVLACASAYSC